MSPAPEHAVSPAPDTVPEMYRFVVVAFVVVDLVEMMSVRPSNVVRLGNVVVADSLESKRSLVQYRFEIPSSRPSVVVAYQFVSERYEDRSDGCTSPSDDVAIAMNVLFGPPISSDDEAILVSPVPPYTTPTDVVADTTPLFACSGPFRVLRVRAFVVRPAVSVCNALNVFAVYVFGIVVEAFMYELTFVSP